MRLRVPEPKGKLDAMTGYSFTTPVWEGDRWVAPVVAGVTAAARIVNGPEDQPRTAPAQWDRINWRAQEEQVRRPRRRNPSAGAGKDRPPEREPPEVELAGPGKNAGKVRARGERNTPPPPGRDRAGE